MRFVSARRDPDLVEGAPKAVAGMRVVMACVGGALARGGADEDQPQVIPELIGKFVHGEGVVRDDVQEVKACSACRGKALRNPPLFRLRKLVGYARG